MTHKARDGLAAGPGRSGAGSGLGGAERPGRARAGSEVEGRHRGRPRSGGEGRSGGAGQPRGSLLAAPQVRPLPDAAPGQARRAGKRILGSVKMQEKLF